MRIVKAEIWTIHDYRQFEDTKVRYFRHPEVSSNDICLNCGHKFHAHGWIDSGGDGQKVCPGDLVLTTENDILYRSPPLTAYTRNK